MQHTESAGVALRIWGGYCAKGSRGRGPETDEDAAVPDLPARDMGPPVRKTRDDAAEMDGRRCLHCLVAIDFGDASLFASRVSPVF